MIPNSPLQKHLTSAESQEYMRRKEERKKASDSSQALRSLLLEVESGGSSTVKSTLIDTTDEMKLMKALDKEEATMLREMDWLLSQDIPHVLQELTVSVEECLQLLKPPPTAPKSLQRVEDQRKPQKLTLDSILPSQRKKGEKLKVEASELAGIMGKKEKTRTTASHKEQPSELVEFSAKNADGSSLFGSFGLSGWKIFVGNVRVSYPHPSRKEKKVRAAADIVTQQPLSLSQVHDSYNYLQVAGKQIKNFVQAVQKRPQVDEGHSRNAEFLERIRNSFDEIVTLVQKSVGCIMGRTELGQKIPTEFCRAHDFSPALPPSLALSVCTTLNGLKVDLLVIQRAKTGGSSRIPGRGSLRGSGGNPLSRGSSRQRAQRVTIPYNGTMVTVVHHLTAEPQVKLLKRIITQIQGVAVICAEVRNKLSSISL